MSFEILTADQLIDRLKGRKYKYTQVHHTWRPNHASFNGSNHLKLQQAMRDNHVNVRGWDNIGQHVTLFPDGKFVTGRPFNQTPAGIAGYNTGAFMTEMIGDFDLGKDKLEGAQLEAMLKLQHFLVTECGAEIMFHREHAAKSCPGTGLDKGWFVQQVATYGQKETPKAPGEIKYIYTGGYAGPALTKIHDYLFKKGHGFDVKRGPDGSIIFLVGPFDTSQPNWKEAYDSIIQIDPGMRLYNPGQAVDWRK